MKKLLIIALLFVVGCGIFEEEEEEMARGILHLIRNPNISQLIARNAYNYVNQIDKKYYSSMANTH